MVNKNNMQQFDYKDTLNLPITNFPMKGNLPQKEPEILKFWENIGLYNLLQQMHQGDEEFRLQDGPPYANGNIHLGHAFNKILKDFVIKSKSFDGYKVPFVPGWDCHGLPIEIKVEKELNKSSHLIDPIVFITKCREYAASQIQKQKEQFIRLGLVADWEHPYITMNPEFEAGVVRVLSKIIVNGHLTREQRALHWCISCGSALAEAEVEYKEKHSPSIYVKFNCLDNEAILTSFKIQKTSNTTDYYNILNGSIAVLIWTTTPWTFPANQAVAVNPNFNYILLYIEKLHQYIIVAENLKAQVLAAININEGDNYLLIASCLGLELHGLLLQHPLYNKKVPIVMGDYVTLDAGTGCVHIAPAHGNDDYIIGRKNNLPIENFIDNRGYFLATTELFANIHINKANPLIIEELKNNNNLLAYNEILHSYPHCWRHKTPLIFMATPQWFISMEQKQLRDNALIAIKQVDWFPNWGQNRIEAMLQPGRPNWCISRQRVWGVPIPFFMHKETGALHPKQLDLLEVIADRIAVNGIEAWYQLDPKELLGEVDALKYNKSTDILDVWFESGSISSVLATMDPNIPNTANLYLEGSDQHRGWFQSSLLVALAANNSAPFKEVVTHGFILDHLGNKMSKSLGNITAPLELISKYGADVLRLWVAASDYSGDLKISTEILTRVTDGYRRIRNTARFLLANLHDFDYKNDIIAIDDLLLLDQKMIDLTIKLQHEILQLYKDYKYHLVYQKIHNFCVEELGSFYLDLIKDRQYTCKVASIPRRSAQTTLYYILESLVRWIAPILSFTAEEIWSYMPNRSVASVFLTKWYNDWPNLSQVDLIDQKFWELVFFVKKEANKQIELARKDGKIGSSLEADLIIYCNEEIFNALSKIGSEIKFLLITAEAKLILQHDPKTTIEIIVNSSNNPKCARCWHRVALVDEIALCPRCKINLTTSEGETRLYA